MSNAATPARETVQPKHTHYVSLENLAIYPALSSPSGYEDEHPTEYRPATPQEVARYQRGDTHSSIDEAAIVDLSSLSPEAASPATLTLLDDPTPAQDTATQQAPEPAVIPQAPEPAVIPQAPAIPPAPTTGGTEG